ncbi:MAG TPA: MBL fold metallo-hydrolase [Candidatus Tectomicrobia bacterium]|nr:MBL fold metallo-hydrolase [Candidatus Tectomicrobia bacterium]
MRVTLWGTRGSLAAPGSETVRYGGNTSCVEVRGDDGTLIVLDAGTGIRRLGEALRGEVRRIHLLLTHLHMDHIQGLGFFEPLNHSGQEVHIWGPPSTTLDLRSRLARYLSPPLFPVRFRDLPCRLMFHDVPLGSFAIGSLQVAAAPVIHPGPTVGYRITEDGVSLAYLPDHEPALGARRFPGEPDWTSGLELAARVDLLIHDAQYTAAEYPHHVGWGHSAIPDAIAFAAKAGAKRLVPFHHHPGHADQLLDRLFDEVCRTSKLPFELSPGREGVTFELGKIRRARGKKPSRSPREC